MATMDSNLHATGHHSRGPLRREVESAFGLQRRLATQDLTLELTPAARSLIAREGTDPTFGARPLKRTIQRLVENPLARAIVAGEFKPGDRIAVDADRVSGTLVFSTSSITVVTEGKPKRDARARRVEPVAPAPGGDRLN